jgi:hypothetical protein
VAPVIIVVLVSFAVAVLIVAAVIGPTATWVMVAVISRVGIVCKPARLRGQRARDVK